MQLDNFILEKYSEYNDIHNEILNTLGRDNATKKYLGDLRYAIFRIDQRKKEYDCNAFYIAYYNDYPIGYISLTNINNSFQISSAILPEYRGQHFAALLLEEFSEKIFETYSYIQRLDLMIENKNIGSLKSAELAGYEKEENKYSQRRV